MSILLANAIKYKDYIFFISFQKNFFQFIEFFSFDDESISKAWACPPTVAGVKFIAILST